MTGMTMFGLFLVAYRPDKHQRVLPMQSWILVDRVSDSRDGGVFPVLATRGACSRLTPGS